jgi:antitoxin HigA-1
VSRTHLHAILSARARVTAEMAVRLEKGLGSTAATWLAMQAAYDLARVKPVKVARLKEAA